MVKTIAVFGGTGNTGRYFVSHALQEDYRVQALLRNPAKLSINSPALIKVKGGLKDDEAIRQVVKGVHGVAFLAGYPRHTTKNGPMDGEMLVGLKKVVAAMEAEGVRRLVVQVGGFTLLPGEPETSCLIKCCVKDLLLGTCLGEAVALADNERMASYLLTKTATIDWTLARPGQLAHSAPKGLVVDAKAATQTVTFNDLAKWELDMMERDDVAAKGLFPGYSTAYNSALLADGQRPATPALPWFPAIDSEATRQASALGQQLGWSILNADGMMMASGKSAGASWQVGVAQFKCNAVLKAPTTWDARLRDPATMTPCVSLTPIGHLSPLLLI